jgi:hypothetical protein
VIFKLKPSPGVSAGGGFGVAGKDGAAVAKSLKFFECGHYNSQLRYDPPFDDMATNSQ